VITKHLKILIAVFVLIFCLPAALWAQEKGLFLSKYYSTKEYKAGTQNWAITQDKRGVLYFANTNGILEYDGSTWRLIKIANNSTVRSLATSEKGTVYAGAFGELGYLAPNAIGALQFHSLINLVDKKHTDFKEVWDVYCFSDTIFFLSDYYLFRYLNGKFDYWESKNKSFYLSFPLNNRLLVHEIGVGLMMLDGNDSLKLIEKGAFFANKRIHNIFPIEQGLLICTRANGLFIYDQSGKEVTIKSLSTISKKGKTLNEYFLKNSYYHGVKIHSNQLALGPVNGPVLIVNKDWDIVDVVNQETMGVKSQTFFLHYQNNGSLWLGLDMGICQVDVLSPLRYWDDTRGINGVLTDVARLRDTLYVSTTSGIFFTPQKESNPYDINLFRPLKGSIEQAWELRYFHPFLTSTQANNKLKTNSLLPEPNAILLASTSNGLMAIAGGEAKKIFGYESLNSIYMDPNEPSRLVLGLSDGAALISYKNGLWIDHGKFLGIEGSITGFQTDLNSDLWLSASYKGFYKVHSPFSRKPKEAKVDFYDTNHGLKSLTSLQILKLKEGLIFFGGEEFYKYNESTNQFDSYKLPETTDTIKQPIDYILESPSWKRVKDEIVSYNYVTYRGDTTLWFGTNLGVFRHSGRTNQDYNDIPSALIRDVLIGDSSLFYGTNFENSGLLDSLGNAQFCVSNNSLIDLGNVLKYKNNAITFFYTLPFSEGDLKNRFSFQLVGYEKHWSEWTTETRKEYTNLPPGIYTFRVKGVNIYGVESKPADFRFTILAPWYRSFLAYIGYLLIIAFLIVLVVKLYTRKLIKEKVDLERIVQERTKEILEQKEEIITQAERIRGAYDWIRAKNIELEYQKKAFEKKKDQLEISNATKNKFFRIISHDLRNPISTFVGTTGYILADIDDFDKQRMKQTIGDLNKLSLTIFNLLENLLDWSTNQMGENLYNPKPVNLVSAVKENVELVKSKLESKGIELEINLPQTLDVFADEYMVYSIIRNLLTNAVKFTSDNGRIEIDATVHDGICSLSIADNGVGISPENLGKLFRIDKHLTTKGTHNEMGSGLGLILCKEFIERNGGEIKVESEVNKGSTFIITLKLP
jgi:signal transduction histidine kinase